MVAIAASRGNKWRSLWSIFTILLVLLSGFSILCWQGYSKLNAEREFELALVISQVDDILDNVKDSAGEAQSLVGKACAGAEVPLRMLAAHSPYVRTLALVFKERAYCSSVFGEMDIPVNQLHEPGRSLLLVEREHNELNSDVLTPLLSFRQDSEDGAVLVGVYPSELSEKLLIEQSSSRKLGSRQLLQIGNTWLDESGQFLEQRPDGDLNWQSYGSSKYLYRIWQGRPEQAPLALLLSGEEGMMMVLVILALGMGGMVYVTWGRMLTPEMEMRRALLRGEFVPFIQPIVSGHDGSLVGAEVLVRWNHYRSGMIRPDLFVPLAEECGVIVPITRELMLEVARELSAHLDQLPPEFHISFNICPIQCHDFSLLEDCQTFLSAFPPGRICLTLELTERVLLEPTEITTLLFERLDQIGVKIALDDFGTGHSSLSYLQQFRVDYLKIDRCFVAMIGSDALSRHILDGTLDLAQRLGLKTVAEGIENQEQADFLRERQVAYLQGFWFAQPMTMKEFNAYLRTAPELPLNEGGWRPAM